MLETACCLLCKALWPEHGSVALHMQTQASLDATYATVIGVFAFLSSVVIGCICEVSSILTVVRPPCHDLWIFEYLETLPSAIGRPRITSNLVDLLMQRRGRSLRFI